MTPQQEAKGEAEHRKRTSLLVLDSLLNPALGRTPKVWITRLRGLRPGMDTHYDVYAIIDARPTWLSMHVRNVCGFRSDRKRECLCSGYESLASALENALGFKVFTETF